MDIIVKDSSRLNEDHGVLTDEDVVLELRLRVRRSGAMSVEGCIYDEHNALIMLDAAREVVVNTNLRRRMQQSGVIVPAHELKT